MGVNIISLTVNKVIKKLALDVVTAGRLRDVIKLMYSNNPADVLKQDILSYAGIDNIGSFGEVNIERIAKIIQKGGYTSLSEILNIGSDAIIHSLRQNIVSSYEEWVIKFQPTEEERIVIQTEIRTYIRRLGMNESSNKNPQRIAKAILKWQNSPNYIKFNYRDWYNDKDYDSIFGARNRVDGLKKLHDILQIYKATR